MRKLLPSSPLRQSSNKQIFFGSESQELNAGGKLFNLRSVSLHVDFGSTVFLQLNEQCPCYGSGRRGE